MNTMNRKRQPNRTVRQISTIWEALEEPLPSAYGDGVRASVTFTEEVVVKVVVVETETGEVVDCVAVVVELAFDCTVVVTGDVVVVCPVGAAVASVFDELESFTFVVVGIVIVVVVVVSDSVMFDVSFVPGVVVSGSEVVVVVVFSSVAVELSEDAVAVFPPASVELLSVVVVSSLITVVVVVVVVIVVLVVVDEFASVVTLFD